MGTTMLVYVVVVEIISMEILHTGMLPIALGPWSLGWSFSWKSPILSSIMPILHRSHS